MANFFIRWLINIPALLIVAQLIPGIKIDDWKTAVTAGLALGLVNAFLRPLLINLTLIFNIISFGLFTLVINGSLFYLVSKTIPGFKVADFWSAFWGALLFSSISFILNTFLTSRAEIKTRSFRSNSAGKTKHSNVIDVEGKIEK